MKASKHQLGLVSDVRSQTPSLIFFFECIIRKPLEDHDRKGSLDVRSITNLRFADDTVGLAEEMQE